MTLYYLGKAPLEGGADVDPRRRNLYGTDVISLGDHGAALDVGPLWRNHGNRLLAPVADPGLVDRVMRILRRDPAGVLIIGDHDLALPFLKTDLPFVFDPTDSATLNYLRRCFALAPSAPLKSANSLRLAFQFGLKELKILHRAKCFVTTGPADERFLSRLSPSAPILRIGNGTPLIKEPPLTPKHDGHTIGFHGGMTWEPNRETAKRLSGSIAQRIAQLPGPPIRIRIAGRPMPDQVQTRHGTNGVEIDGFVPDLKNWLSSLTIYVMPMFLGAGIKNKLIEAMAAGLPVLTNRRGAEALCTEGRRAIAIAEGEEKIAIAVRSLLGEPEELQRMRRDARDYAERHFNWAEHQQRFQNMTANLARERPF